MNVGVSLDFCRVFEGFPKVSLFFARFLKIFRGFPWFSHGFRMVSEKFRRFCAAFNLRKVFLPQVSLWFSAVLFGRFDNGGSLGSSTRKFN